MGRKWRNEVDAALFEVIAALCSGLFTGAAIYITLVEHPARVECGTPFAVTEFAPSYYRRAAVRQDFLSLRVVVLLLERETLAETELRAFVAEIGAAGASG